MKYPELKSIQDLCESKLVTLPPEYKKRYLAEIKDLKKWSLFLQTNKAQEILSLKDKMLPTNKSGSVILFLLGASCVDPIKESLAVQQKKFGKADPPDIDIDLHPETRDPVKAFLVEKFGKERVCSVGTVGTYKTKNVILDVARALGLDVKEANEVTKGLDIEVGEGDDEKKLDKASFEEICQSQPELAAYFEAHPDVLHHAEILRNQAKNTGTHAGGVIVSNLNLLENIPVFKDKEDRIVSCWAESGEAQDLSSLGLVKYDVLGLCLEENTLIKTDIGDIPVRLVDGFSIECLDENGKPFFLSSKDFILIETGEKDLVEIELEDGETIKCSYDHCFFKKI